MLLLCSRTRKLVNMKMLTNPKFSFSQDLLKCSQLHLPAFASLTVLCWLCRALSGASLWYVGMTRHGSHGVLLGHVQAWSVWNRLPVWWYFNQRDMRAGGKNPLPFSPLDWLGWDTSQKAVPWGWTVSCTEQQWTRWLTPSCMGSLSLSLNHSLVPHSVPWGFTP